jgi:SAM-dependent MidA family methyltransferase
VNSCVTRASYNAGVPLLEPASVSTLLRQRVHEAIAHEGGWLPFDAFMAMALYEPGLGYYARSSRQFGAMPASGSDFVTAPEISPLFGAALAVQLRQALEVSETSEITEFGAGSGALAESLLDTLGARCQYYAIVELSAALRERQAQRLARFGSKVRWLDALPGRMHGVVVGNEVLDAMPVQLLHFDGSTWFERGVGLHGETLAWADRATDLRPPLQDAGFVPGTTTEIHAQAQAFIHTLADKLGRGAAFFIDYGFPEAEYYHPQRTGGTLMCHRAHLMDDNALADVGDKDITAHVNFSAIALAAQDAGLQVDGYTTQAHFLFNCGLATLLEAADTRQRAHAHKLVAEHEMGELFKVIALSRGLDWQPLGFTQGDRSHRL